MAVEITLSFMMGPMEGRSERTDSLPAYNDSAAYSRIRHPGEARETGVGNLPYSRGVIPFREHPEGEALMVNEKTGDGWAPFMSEFVPRGLYQGNSPAKWICPEPCAVNGDKHCYIRRQFTNSIQFWLPIR